MLFRYGNFDAVLRIRSKQISVIATKDDLKQQLDVNIDINMAYAVAKVCTLFQDQKSKKKNNNNNIHRFI